MTRRGWPHRHPPNVPFALNRGSEQARGLVAWWPSLASIGANTLRDLSGYKRTDGIFNGTIVWTPDGERGHALDFGASDYVDVGHINELDGAVTATLSFWAKRNTSGSAIVGQSSSSATSRFSIMVYTDGNIYYIARNGSNSHGLVANTSTAWQFVTHVYNGNGAANADRTKGYINGVPQTLTFSLTIPASFPTFPGNFNVGREVTGSALESNGLISDVRLYNRALSDREVWQLYAPATRWELYEPIAPPKRWVVAVAGGAGVPKHFMHYQRMAAQ